MKKILLITFLLFPFGQEVSADDQGCCSWNAGLDYCQANEMWMCDNKQQSPTCSCNFKKELEYERSFLGSLRNKKENIEKDRHSYIGSLRNQTQIEKARRCSGGNDTKQCKRQSEDLEADYNNDVNYYESLVGDANREIDLEIMGRELKISQMTDSLESLVNQELGDIPTVGVDGLRCDENQKLSRDRTRCERIPNCPKYGYFSKEEDVCVCQEGYRITSNNLNCLKDMVAPPNGYLTGKGFACNEGYKRVNESCVATKQHNNKIPTPESFGELVKEQLFSNSEQITPATPEIVEEEVKPEDVVGEDLVEDFIETKPLIEEAQDILKEKETWTRSEEEIPVFISEREVERKKEKKKPFLGRMFSWFNNLFK